ncbi:MAG: hypothetical protein ABI406_14170 [Ktedonobacteraceae bacterium]
MRLLVQVGKGHRQREYCDNSCRQDAFRKRREQAEHERHQAELQERFGAYLLETLYLLDIITQRSSPELTHLVTWAINAEAGRQVHTAREAATRKMWKLQKHLDQREQVGEQRRE